MLLARWLNEMTASGQFTAWNVDLLPDADIAVLEYLRQVRGQ
jgi:hypothetical protein